VGEEEGGQVDDDIGVDVAFNPSIAIADDLVPDTPVTTL
jgi:hypothetical protein